MQSIGMPMSLLEISFITKIDRCRRFDCQERGVHKISVSQKIQHLRRDKWEGATGRTYAIGRDPALDKSAIPEWISREQCCKVSTYG